jgi:hypothetical protein
MIFHSIVHEYEDFIIELIPVHCVITNGYPVPHEHLQIRWIPFKKLRVLDFTGADIPVLDIIHNQFEHINVGIFF